MMGRVLLLLAFCLQAAPLSAQVLPPDFLCVRGDTLFWAPPSNTCGPFQAYLVMKATAPNGPFDTLAVITDPTQNFYFDAMAGFDEVYYFLLSAHDCPGQAQIPSDTLDNRPPEETAILSVSVQGDEVLIQWPPNPSPEVSGYIIYRVTPSGTVPIDTVFGALSYVDSTADPNAQSVGYFVNALDPCGNTSLFNLEHRTIFLEAAPSPCQQGIRLQWNPYQNWNQGIRLQEVWLSLDGEPFQLVAELPPDADTFLLDVLDDSREHCFFLRAEENLTGAASRSNVVCLQPDIVQAVRYLRWKEISTQTDNSVSLSWSWNPDAELTAFEILRSLDGVTFQGLGEQPPTLPLPSIASAEDPPGGLSGPLHYALRTRDACDTVLVWPSAATILLGGNSPAAGINQLSWSAFQVEGATPASYRLLRSENGGNFLPIATLDPSSNAYEDLLPPERSSGVSLCYRVEGRGFYLLPDGSVDSVVVRSNVFCIEQDLPFFVPNAFAPHGVNFEFKPALRFVEGFQYRMSIFDRYGRKVFETDDPQHGWNGKYEGRDLPAGGYVYRIVLTSPSGKVQEKTGVVVLLR